MMIKNLRVAVSFITAISMIAVQAIPAQEGAAAGLSLVEEAEELYRGGEYYEAMDRAAAMLAGERSTEGDRIRSEWVIFKSAMKLVEERYARRAAKRLLELDPGYEPEGVDVKIDEWRFFQEIRAEVTGELVIKGVPSNARIMVDGKDTREGPGAIWVLEGERQIEVQCPGYEDKSFIESVAPGHKKGIDVRMIREAGARLEQGAQGQPSLMPERLEGRRSRRGSKKWWYIGGAAALTGAGVFLGLSGGQDGKDETLPGPPPPPPSEP